MAKQAKSEFDPKEYGFPEGTTAREALDAILQIQREKAHVESALKKIHELGGQAILLLGISCDQSHSIAVPLLALPGSKSSQLLIVRAALAKAMLECDAAVKADQAANN